MQSVKPNFFLVGSPRYGTTFLYEHLRRHPDVFMPHSEERYRRHKEPHFFCQELIALPGLRVQDKAAYNRLFKPASTQQCIGDASSLYLYSEEAPYRIRAYSPDAKIIIVLQDPVDMMIAWHQYCVKWGHENVRDFKKAILLESIRAKGHRIPPGSGYPSCLLYTRMASFSKQVARYFDIFGQQAVHVSLLEDFDSTPTQTIAEIEDFLDISRSNKTEYASYQAINTENQERPLSTKLLEYIHEYATGNKGISPYIPRVIKQALHSGLNFLRKPAQDPLTDQYFLDTLRARMKPDILALEQLILRDLSHWRVARHELMRSTL